MNKASLATIIFLCPAFCTEAADWPMYRADATRAGHTAEQLPDKLSLAWTHTARHRPMPAWPSRNRLQFDRAYQPVIAGGTLFFGSSADCKVYALDAATGKTRWTFFTGGPVRFAPAVWQGRVFVAGDDGYLRCLAAADGKELWKLRGGPRGDMLLGNDRMISRWPARGGPVVADGVLYFAAGIWPSEGIYIYAIDPATGKVLWCNDSSGGIEMDQPHGGARAKSGTSAQGYLVARGDTLFLPTGRAVPAVFDRADGKFRCFHLQRYGGLGGADIVAIDDYFFNQGMIYANDFGVAPFRAGTQVALHPSLIISSKQTTLTAFDRKQPWVKKEKLDRRGKKIKVLLPAPPLWTGTLPHDADAALIVSGEKIIAGGSGKVSLVDVVSHETVWTADVRGNACGLAVADGRLYVSTDEGDIYCFDGSETPNPPTIRPPQPAKSGGNPLYAAAAEEIVRRTGIRKGYCLDMACGDGRLALELARQTELQIYAVDRDPVKVNAARQMSDTAGLYGVRVTVNVADPAKAAEPNWFADLVVSGRGVSEGATSDLEEAAENSQRPCGGMICVGKPGAMRQSIHGPLKGAGDWTHQYRGPANSLCSSDTRVRGPLAMLWFRDTDFFLPNRHGRGPAPLVHNGRMFIEGVNALRAVNIYNGRTLWEFPLEGILKPYHQEHLMGVAGTGSNICLGGDRVFVHTGDKCLCIDVCDGRKVAELKTPPQPDGKPGTWGYIACADGTLFGSLANTQHIVKYPWQKADMSRLFTESLLFFAMDPATGKLKWTYQPKHSIRHNPIAIGQGKVFLIDRPLAPIDRLDFDSAKLQGEAKRLAGEKSTDEREEYRRLTEHRTGRLLALDGKTGAMAWQTDEGLFGTLLALSAKHDVLLMSHQRTRFELKSESMGRMAAYRASSGKGLWDVEAKYISRPILNDRTIYAQPGAWDLLTGKQLPFSFTRSYGCGTIAGSQRMIVFRRATLGYIDLGGSRVTENYGGIRPGCWINAIPAGGLVLMADAASWCTCSYLNQATCALQPGDAPTTDGRSGKK